MKIAASFALVLFCSLPLWARPLIIGHRGASGYLPEHTLEAYKLAVEQGADYIEPDLVPTRDGHLVARHENEISETTNVASKPEFAARRVTKTIDGRQVTGWFTEDFTLAELKTLRALGRNAASRKHDGRYQLVTLPEIITAVQTWEKDLNRRIGLYPETKHPSYFRSWGLPLEETLVKTLHEAGYQGPDAPVIIQSFEVSNLKLLKGITRLPLAQLVDDSGAPQDWVQAQDGRTYRDMLKPEGLREVATYASIVAPYKGLLMTRDGQGEWQAATAVIGDAHRAGLKVHSWTFRAENSLLPPSLRKGIDSDSEGNLSGEVSRFLKAGLDGVFSNHPDQAVRARDQ